MRISDWSSECALPIFEGKLRRGDGYIATEGGAAASERLIRLNRLEAIEDLRPKSAAQVETADASLTAAGKAAQQASEQLATGRTALSRADQMLREALRAADEAALALERLNGKREQLESRLNRSEEHTSELQSLMSNSYAVFCLNTKQHTKEHQETTK